MELVGVLRQLWARRVFVAAGLILAVAAALLIGGSPVASSGLAKTRVVLDTPRSQLVTDDPSGAGTLPWRAQMLTALIATDPVRTRIASEMGIPADRLAVTDLELTAPVVPASLPVSASQAAAAPTEPYVVRVYTDDVLPIVSIETSAPGSAAAARLAQATVHALQAGASPQDTAELQGMTVRQTGPLHVREIAGGSGRKKMLVIAVVLFGLWCACLLLGPLVSRAMRTLRETPALDG